MRNEELSQGKNVSLGEELLNGRGPTVSGYVTGRLKLIDNDFKMRDTPCPLDIA